MIKKAIIYLIDQCADIKKHYKTKRKFKYVRNHFAENSDSSNLKHKKRILNTQQFLNTMIYKDENWNYIKFLSDYRATMQTGFRILYEDNKCDGLNTKYRIYKEKVIVQTECLMDNWLCFYQDLPNLDGYEFGFDIIPYSVFTEIQIAFQYQDLGNRYRFMIRNNEEAVFECAYRGEFYHSLWSKPFQLGLRKKHHIKLIVRQKVFSFFVDGNCIYSIKEVKPFITGNKLCLIFWNIDDQRAIECEVSNLYVDELGV